MVAPRAHRIAQCGEPGALDQGRVGRKLRARHSAGVESVDVIGIRAQARLFQLQRPRHQVLNPLLDLGVGGTVRRGNEAVVGVLAGVQYTHAIKLAEQNHG